MRRMLGSSSTIKILPIVSGFLFVLTVPGCKDQRKTNSIRTVSGEHKIPSLSPGNVSGDSQPQTCSAGLGGEKRLKDSAQRSLRNRRACILDINADVLISVMTAEDNGATCRRSIH